ncbi:MAG: response regulator, partial [Gammaproteobacteria bacterium]
ERIFALFAQAERTPDRAQGGLGLGLALVKSLVELHGGSVRCDAAPSGRGARFSVTLPRLRQEQSADDHAGQATDAGGEGGLRVLIVDDNADAADMLAMFVAALGHHTHVELSSARAIAAQKEQPFDVGLFDLGLPGMDGHGLARHFRARPESAGMLLLAVTGYGESADRQASRAAGFDQHLVKPVELDTLRRLLSDYRPPP